MNGNLLRSQGLLAVAVGAGVVIGAAGVFLYEHLFKEKRRLILQNDVTKLGISVTELRRELEELRESQKRRIRRIRAKPETSADPARAPDFESDIVSTLDDDEEFFDLSDEDTLEASLLSTEDARFIDVDRIINGAPEEKSQCLGLLIEMYDKNKDDPEVLWRLAKVCHGLSGVKLMEGDTDRQKDYINKGLEYATKCLEIAPRSSNAHKWYAICIGARSETQGVKDKLKDGLAFKEHIVEALSLKPSDATLHHLLGRFLFEVASLSWMERKLATTLFGEVPEATFPEALESLVRAEELAETPWKENRLLIAKCFIQIGEYSTALDWLDKAEEVELLSKEDRKAEIEIANLKKKYQNQRGLL